MNQHGPQDALIYYLLLETLESILANHFYDLELRLCDMLSILLSVCMQSRYHEHSSTETVLFLKRKASGLIASLLKQCSSRAEL